ncbi:hypothetical protein [Streptomyces lydicus]|uniref:hypothetical protein n=1 Tax=Streptomyces lydicus TaxID=47763 RepID=UPI0037B5F401
MPAPDDPRFEWIHVPECGNEDQWIRGSCNHLTSIPVHAQPTDELVAHLCPDCDAQLPAEWSRLRRSIKLSGVAFERLHHGGPEIGSTGDRPKPWLR